MAAAEDNQPAHDQGRVTPQEATGPISRMVGRLARGDISPLASGITTALLMLVMGIGCVMIAMEVAKDTVKETLDEELSTVASLAAQRIDPVAHARLTDISQYNGELYQEVVAPLREMLLASPNMQYMYTVRMTEQGLRFIVDAAYPVDSTGDGVIDQAELGELISKPDPAMHLAYLTGKAAVSPQITVDKWGTFVSGFAPVWSADGEIECIVGVDTTAERYLSRVRRIHRAAIMATGVGLLASTAFGVLVCIMQRKRQEAASTIVTSEARYRAIIEGTDLFAWEFCVEDDRFIYLSFEHERLGYSREQWLEPGFWDSIVHPDERVQTAQDCIAEIMARRAHRLNYRVVAADGRIVHISDYVSVPEIDDVKTIVRGVAVDMTERVNAAEALARAESLQAKVAAQIPGMIFQLRYGTDGVLSFPYASNAIKDLFGVSPSQVRSSAEPVLLTVHPEDHDGVIRSIQESAMKLTQWRCEFRIKRPDESDRWLIGESTPELHEDGSVLWHGFLADITEKKTAEKAMLDATADARRLAEASREKAEEASRVKSEFLANMSHEIRTPMTAILGYADLLAENDGTETSDNHRQECIDTIRRNGEHLLTIINDILDLSKIESGKLTIESLAISVGEVLSQVEMLLHPKALGKGIELKFVQQTELPATIHSDPVRLGQILVNLVSNAIKFTENGGVTVGVGLDTSSARGPMLRVQVADTGIGMTPEQLSRVFTAFEQADASTTRKYGGSGLGLRISQKLTEMLGGEIDVQSAVEQGSVFTLTIPTGSLDGVEMIHLQQTLVGATQSAVSPVPKIEEQPLLGMRIWLAEDGLDNQRLFAVHLRRAGAIVTVFDNGMKVLEAFTRDGTVEGPLSNDPPCDVLLTDIQMPVMDGYTLTRLLRSKGWPGRIVALTAHAMSGDAQSCIAAGCDAYASKPIDRAGLIAACLPGSGRKDSKRKAG